MNRGTWALWTPMKQNWRKLIKQRPWENLWYWGRIWNISPQKWYLNVFPFNKLCISFESEHCYNRPAAFRESFKAYYTLFRITSSNESILSPLKPPNVPIFHNSATMFPEYFIRHTILRCPDSLQYGQNSYMGDNPIESGCLVCFIPNIHFFRKLDQRKIKVIKNSWRKKEFKYNFGEVGFICFLSTIKFLTAFVWIIVLIWDNT